MEDIRRVFFFWLVGAATEGRRGNAKAPAREARKTRHFVRSGSSFIIQASPKDRVAWWKNATAPLQLATGCFTALCVFSSEWRKKPEPLDTGIQFELKQAVGRVAQKACNDASH